MADVEGEDLPFSASLPFAKLPVQDGVGQRALLMHMREHQLSDISQGEFPEFPGPRAHVFCADSQGYVPPGIFEIPAINLRPS